MTTASEREPSGDIAIVGMAGRFPGAADVSEFWRNLRDGVESITRYDEETLRAAGIAADMLADPRYVRAAPVLSDVDMFDAHFFGYPAREAALIDPQQRIFLECAWQALEDAGYAPGMMADTVGVYAGAALSTYLLHHLLAGRGVATIAETLELLVTNDKDYLANRVSYKLGLSGPAVAVQTACSSSLVAVHLAAQALLDGDCDVALAGGVAVRLPQPSGYLWQEGLIFSADGHCRPFDANATGTMFGSGAGVVVLKRAEDAVADGDRILAVVKGTGVTNDGSAKIGYTAPGVDGQARAIDMALDLAGIEPETVSAVEAHGTATPLGDPIEVAALTRVFGTRRPGTCALGSVKSNVGHLDTAAGITGLIKAVLQLQHGKLVPSLNFERPNPEIDFDRGPFYVNTELRDWIPADAPRRIGVSSFGMGGTNAHIVLEEGPSAPVRPRAEGRPELIVLSAKTRQALDDSAVQLAEALRGNDLALADVSHTLQVGRQPLAFRRVVVAETPAEAVASLAGESPDRVADGAAGDRFRLVFLFPGQGSQHPGMGADLYAAEPVFRAEVDACAEVLTGPLGLDLREVLYPPDGTDPAAAAERIERTALAQPALFVIEYALTELLASWGLRPAAMVGHSVGEITAACVSGVLDRDDALRLVAARGRLMQALPPGAMLSISLPAQEVRGFLPASVALAAVNGPELCVASGPADDIAVMMRELSQLHVPCRLLHTSHAFHSAMMEPMLAPFAAEIAGIELRAPRIPYVSNVTGHWAAPDHDYWVRHVREPVRFADAVQVLTEAAGTVLLEVGPGQTLGTLARQGSRQVPVVTAMPRAGAGESDRDALLRAVGRLWTTGAPVDFAAVRGADQPARVSLPTYPFQRRRHWIEPATQGSVGSIESIEVAVGQSDEDGVVDTRPPISTTYAAPRDDRERLIVGVWESLLGVAPIGVRDNFMELGGHSLLATKMVARIKDAFGVPLTLRQTLEAPTVADLAALVVTLRGSSPADLESIEDELPQAVPDPGTLHEPFALTEIQQAQWLGRLGAFEGGNVAAHVYWEVDATDLDLARLEDTWQHVLARHPMLRAVVLTDGSQQILADVGRYRIDVLDLRDSTEADAALLAVRTDLTERMRPADTWPLFDIKATLLPAGRTRLHLGFDLLIADIGSIRLISRDWRKLYAQETLPALELTYRDYVLALERVRSTPRYERARDYWRARVGQLPARPDLPLAIAPSSIERPESASYNHVLDAATWARITARAGALGLTPSSVLLAAYATAVGRWSRTGAFTLNVTMINRLAVHERVADLVGEFASFDLLPVDLLGQPDIASLARSLHEQSWADMEHRTFSGVEVLRELARERGGVGEAVSPVVFTSTIVQSSEPGDETWFGWLGEIAHEIAQTPQVWLDFALLETADGVRLAWHGVRQIFPDGVLDSMFEAFRGLVDQLAESADAWSSALDVWPRQRAVAESVNATDTLVPNGLLSDGVVEWARREPDRVAVVAADGRTLSYGDLVGWAAAVADTLRERGVAPGVLVGVAMAKSPEQVVGALAVLLAGGAYLPIDVDLPAERRAHLVTAAGCAHLLTRADDEVLQWPSGLHSIAVDSCRDSPAKPVDQPGSPDDVAYVIYTSGSTGLPKGVAVSHRAALNTCVDLCSRYDIGPDDAMLGLSALNFDLSVFDVFGMLAVGGRLVLPAHGSNRDPGHWLDLIERHGVTVWNSVPALADMAVTHLADTESAPLAGVRLAMWSGDWIPVDLPDRWRERSPACRRVSLGGATEAAIWSIHYEIGEVDPAWDSIPYGRPLANQRFHVLNDRFQDCPVWVTGELYIGGVGLALSYWNDPERTAERFVHHPVTGERLYRTGDLGRWRPDGEIEFLGRDDFQVKVGGYRIELGEIEVALGKHAAVSSAVALAVGDRHHRRLVAYIVPTDPGTDHDTLGAEVGEQATLALPGYMVPGTITVVDRLPLTANGKVDRNALTTLASARATDAVPAVEGGPVAEALARIIAEVLNVEAVGLHDNLFALGGDSITGIRIVSRATAEGFDITPADLFAHQNTAALAAVVIARGGTVDAGEADLPLSRYQRTLVEHAGEPAAVPAYQVLLPITDVDAAQAAVRGLLARHPALRLRLVADDTGWRQRVAPADETDESAPPVRLGALPEARRSAALAQMGADLADELDPVRGPVAKAAVFDLGPDDQRLALAVSLLAVDAASWPVLLRELAVDWAEPANPFAGGPMALTTITDTATADQQALTGTYWPTAETPTQQRTVHLSRESTADLLDGARRVLRVAAPEIAAVALAVALSRRDAETPVVIDLERDVRQAGAVDLTGAVGPFAEITPVLIDLARPDLGELVVGVKEACRTKMIRHSPGSRTLVRHVGDVGTSGVTADAPYPMTITSSVLDGQFTIGVTGPGAADLAAALTTALDDLVAHVREPRSGVVAPSDFPLSGLDSAELEMFLAAVTGGPARSTQATAAGSARED
ncbi:hybrid non-ribosomal peptide synthetase/type I polyketide synthase [Actinokineospora sp.]|uniref:hybrid non-ribosomal peptide synthetase/type I polyketide synthase n=1 Tax=Actinokineospora sp. TaxID=1872133 RepID=UPI00403787AD